MFFSWEQSSPTLLVAYGYQDYDITRENQNYNYNYRIRKNTKKRTKIILKEKKFKNFKIRDKYDQRKCPICISKYKNEEYVIVLKCRHIYHKDCNHKSITKCPICRL